MGNRIICNIEKHNSSKKDEINEMYVVDKIIAKLDIYDPKISDKDIDNFISDFDL